MSGRDIDVVTVTPNPALDWTLTIEGFTPGSVNRVERDDLQPGGKGVNVASALAACGHRVAATGFLGQENDAAFVAFLERSGIVDRFRRVSGSTRTGIKIADAVKDQTTDINFPGAAVTAADVAALEREVAALAADGRWLVLAGSLPPGTPPTLYRDLARAAKSAGCHVAIDGSGDALRHAIAAAPDVIKPNIHELEVLLETSLPGTAQVADAARGLVRGGVPLVVVSMGGDGALFLTGAEATLARPPRIAVHSTVGAGDAMVAGIVAARLAGRALPDLARLATAFSVATLSGHGRRPGFADAVRAAADAVMLEAIG